MKPHTRKQRIWVHGDNGITYTAEKDEVSAKSQLTVTGLNQLFSVFFLSRFYLAVTLQTNLHFLRLAVFFFFPLPDRFCDHPAEVKARVNKSDPSLKILPFCKADWVWITKLRISLIVSWHGKKRDLNCSHAFLHFAPKHYRILFLER